MNILILDDLRERHEVFKIRYQGHQLFHAWTAEECISLLKKQKYDLITLDHDLGEVRSESYNEAFLAKDGGDVAHWIANHLDKALYPPKVIIHSWNPNGSRSMYLTLQSVGISVEREEFHPTDDEWNEANKVLFFTDIPVDEWTP